MKGKDFFSRKRKDDNIDTPYSFTEQLLENEKFDYEKAVLEPACGKMAIVKVLRKYWDEEFYCMYDKYTHRSFFGDDFLTSNSRSDYIITNPPFSFWDEFVQKAKQVTTEKFAFLGRLEFLTGIKRFEEKLYFDLDYPLTKVYIFVRKSNLSFTKKYPELREDGKYPAGMYHYAWFIFEKNTNTKFGKSLSTFRNSQIKWINNQKYILRKKDV